MVRPVLGPNVIARYDHELHRARRHRADRRRDGRRRQPARRAHVEGAARRALEAAQAERRTGVRATRQWWEARAPILERVIEPGALPDRGAGRTRPRARRTTRPTRPSTPFEFGLQRILDGVEALVEAELRTARANLSTQLVESRWTLFLSFEISPWPRRESNGGEPFSCVRCGPRCSRVVAALFACAVGAAPAIADTVVIDSVDSPASVFQPAERHDRDRGHGPLGVRPGRDDAHGHVAQARTGPPINETRGPERRADRAHVQHAPGTYKFLCTLHTGMTGSITVEAPERSSACSCSPRPAASATTRSRRASRRSRRSARPTASRSSPPRTRPQFTDANLAHVRRRRLPVDDRRGPQRRPAGRVRALHPGRRRLRRRPRRVRHRVLAGRGSASWSAATSATTRPERRRAAVDIEDGDEPSTTGLPTRWTRTDEWYNFQHPTTPVVNGNTTVADYSPRARHVKVLATVDESTYDEQDGNTIDDDHPVAWCSDFDGGRSWYTAMGHTQASFSEAAVPRAPARRPAHRGRRRAATAATSATCRRPRPTSRRSRSTTTRTPRWRSTSPRTGARSTSSSTVASRCGHPTTRRPRRRVGTIPVTLSHENGLLGIQLAPNFDTTDHIYLAYSALPDASNQNRVSRFTLTGNTLGQEQIIYTWQHQRQECCHTGGSLDFGRRRQPLPLHGRQHEPVRARLQPDRRAARPRDLGRPAHVGQHEQPERQDPAHPADRRTPTGAPGVGTTYTIPQGNMFAGRARRRPCPRSTRWASGTRSGSTSTRRPAGS